jgi:Mce-associated membrane protein
MSGQTEFADDQPSLATAVADRKDVDDEGLKHVGESQQDSADPDSIDSVEDEHKPKSRRPISSVRLAMMLGLAILLAIGGLVGWLGHRTYHSHRDFERRQQFLAVGRQAAVNLTSIDYTHAEADVQRILDSATGQFLDDFQRRSPTFIELVKRAQSKSEGTIAQAGLESVNGHDAQVLVAVMVKSSVAGADHERPRGWRMRISVQAVGENARVSNVEFVP